MFYLYACYLVAVRLLVLFNVWYVSISCIQNAGNNVWSIWPWFVLPCWFSALLVPFFPKLMVMIWRIGLQKTSKLDKLVLRGHHCLLGWSYLICLFLLLGQFFILLGFFYSNYSSIVLGAFMVWATSHIPYGPSLFDDDERTIGEKIYDFHLVTLSGRILCTTNLLTCLEIVRMSELASNNDPFISMEALRIWIRANFKTWNPSNDIAISGPPTLHVLNDFSRCFSTIQGQQYWRWLIQLAPPDTLF